MLRDRGTVEADLRAFIDDFHRKLGWRGWTDRLRRKRVKVTPGLVAGAIEIAEIADGSFMSIPCTVEAAAELYVGYFEAFAQGCDVTHDDVVFLASFGEFSYGIVADVEVNLDLPARQEAAQLAWQKFFATQNVQLDA